MSQITSGPQAWEVFHAFLKREPLSFKVESGDICVVVNRMDRITEGYVCLTGQQVAGRHCQLTYNMDEWREKYRTGNCKFI